MTQLNKKRIGVLKEPVTKRLRFYVYFIANALRFSYIYVAAKVFAIIERREFVPSSFRNALAIIREKHFNLVPEENIAPLFDIDPARASLDVGANEGKYTLLMASKCRHVYAWEPNPRTARKLQENAKNCTNVTVFNNALGEHEGVFDLHLHELPIYDSLVVKREGYIRTIKVKVCTLDSYEFPERVGLIKIDTEGAELPIIKGGRRTIEKLRPRLVIEVHEPYENTVKQILSLLPFYRWYNCYKYPRLLGQRASHLVGVPRDEPQDMELIARYTADRNLATRHERTQS